MKIKESVSFIIPVYNEENLVRRCVESCIGELSRDFDDFEIILVNDGSTDRTLEMMQAEAGKDTRIKVVNNLINLNIGISMQTGYMLASKDYVFFNSVDLPLGPGEISKLIPHMTGCDVLVVERKSYAGYTTWRLITSILNRLLIKIMFPHASRGINDFNFMQIYRRAVLPQIMPLARGPVFTAPEMILRACYRGLRVKTEKVDYLPRTEGKGSFGKPHDIFWAVYETLRFRLTTLLMGKSGLQ